MNNKYKIGDKVRFYDNQEVGKIFDIENNIDYGILYWIEVSNGSFCVAESDINGHYI